jgi:hypothetical protein
VKDHSLCSYFNGGLQWKSNSTGTTLSHLINSVQLFFGQRRGGIRCVSGVCRNFPAFEGGRLDVVSRF